MNSIASPSQRFSDLHQSLSAKFRKHNVGLQAVNTGMSAVSYVPEQALVFAYVRLHSEALTVERQIGLGGTEIDLQRHPLIELRLTDRHLALEFVMSPLAWWDQRNLIGKLSLRRYRDELRDLLLSFDPEMVTGHWHGLHLDDEHLTLGHLRSTRVMEAWLQTFSDGRDPIRLGLWLDANVLNSDSAPDLFESAQALYSVYRFVSWTGRNDFQSFYDQRQQSR